MTAKTDRRVMRTKEALNKALISLIMEKPYDKITVQNILDRANIGRATFYAHFHDKDDLLTGRGSAEFMRLIQPNLPESSVPDLLELFQHVEENKALAKALLGTGGADVVIKMLQKSFYASWLNWAEHQPSIDSRPDVVAHFLTGGVMSLITWWLNEEMPIPAQEINTIFQKLIANMQ